MLCVTKGMTFKELKNYISENYYRRTGILKKQLLFNETCKEKKCYYFQLN